MAADTNVGDLTLPAPARLSATVLDPANQPVSAQVSMPNLNHDVVAGFGSLLGIPIASGDSQIYNSQNTAADGTAAFTLWPTSSVTLYVAPTANPALLPTTTPPINLAGSVSLVVAYQPNGSVSVIGGSPDYYITSENTPLSAPAPGVLANDSNPTGLALQAVLAQAPSHGTLALNADGSLTYAPAAGFAGTDQFTYRATSTSGVQTAPIPVTITVTPPPLPLITSLSPTNGPTMGGTTVTITGTRLTAASAVAFGTLPASSFTVVNDTTITAVAPPGNPGQVDVHVTTPNGTSATNAADQYTYTAADTRSHRA